MENAGWEGRSESANRIEAAPYQFRLDLPVGGQDMRRGIVASEHTVVQCSGKAMLNDL